jgi:hypothetical protein
VVGVKVNARVADAPGAIAVLKAAHWNSLVAGAAGMFMLTGTSPVFVIVSVRVADAESGIVPKPIEAEKLIAVIALRARPRHRSTRSLTVVFSVSGRSKLKGPVVVGANRTSTVIVCPGSNVAGSGREVPTTLYGAMLPMAETVKQSFALEEFVMVNCRWLELNDGGTPVPNTASGKFWGSGVTSEIPFGFGHEDTVVPPSLIRRVVAVMSPLGCPLGVNGTAEQSSSPLKLLMITAETVPEVLPPNISAALPLVALGLICGRLMAEVADVVRAI